MLYQIHIKMSVKNRFFFPSSLVKNDFVAMVMKKKISLNKNKIIQFL